MLRLGAQTRNPQGETNAHFQTVLIRLPASLQSTEGSLRSRSSARKSQPRPVPYTKSSARAPPPFQRPLPQTSPQRSPIRSSRSFASWATANNQHRSCMLNSSATASSSHSDLLTSHAHQASRPLRVSPVFVLRVLAAVSTSPLTWILLYFDTLLSYLTLSRFARLLCTLSNRVSLLLGLTAPHRIQGMRVDPYHCAAVPTSL